VILDDNPNAYINSENRLFISTGLLKYTSSYEALIGVLAHEIGHLSNFHISKRMDSINNLKTISNLGTFSVIASSLLTQNNSFLVESLIANQVGIQNYYLQFSRDQEREADFYAINTLNKLQLSTVPLIEFLNLLEKQSLQKIVTDEYFKFSTHPIYNERYKVIELNKKNQTNKFDKKINEQFNFIKAKIFGFTESDETSFKEYLTYNYLIYAKSIILSRKGKLKESMHLINILLQNNPNQYFILETKADILLSHGYTLEAKKFYEKVSKVYPNNHYINKRIFEIEFNSYKINKTIFSNNLFNKFNFLLEIFPTDKILHNKFKEIAILNNNINWQNFFDTKDMIYDDKKEAIINLQMILDKTNDEMLKKLINQKLQIIHDE